MRERELIARLRGLATSPAARGLLDDAALLDGLVLSHDSIAEGVHYFPADPPESIGWKLAAVNLSDLAAKGAEPAGALLSLTLRSGEGDGEWEERFLTGFAAACESYGLPLLGGDTIALPPRAPRVLGLTVIGRAGAKVPSRAGGCPGDRLWIAGVLGDSAAGLASLRRDPRATGLLVDVYRRPVPQLAAGRALATIATAMMDVSDGLLLDLERMCAASGCGAAVDLAALPLSRTYLAERGTGRAARLFAATGGDDYALLAALPPDADPIVTLCLPEKTRMAEVGTLTAGTGLALTDGGEPVPLPERLGHEHIA